jgi:uncharacterized membrane protein SpoIIM required for sporulation
MEGNGENRQRPDPVASLVALFWRATESTREVDWKAMSSLAILIAIGSALIGAGVGGTFSFWYSSSHEDTVSTVVVTAMFIVIILLAFWLTAVYTPRKINRLRSQLDKKAIEMTVREAVDDGLV